MGSPFLMCTNVVDRTPRLRQWAQKKQKIEEELLLDRASQNFGIALPDLLAREQDETIPELVRVLLSEMRERGAL